MDNGHEPATKQDLREMEERMDNRFATKQDLREIAEQLRSEFQHGFDDLKETLRDSQTELLKAFYSFTTSNQERLAQVEASDAAIVKRLGVLEARVTDLERKINFPNQ